jgi:hypothetical protein
MSCDDTLVCGVRMVTAPDDGVDAYPRGAHPRNVDGY